MKKQLKKETQNKQDEGSFSSKRAIIERPIPLEVDLENREVIIRHEVRQDLNIDFSSTNVDSLIKTYLDAKDSKKVIQSLSKAKEGLEKPIQFDFIHPLTLKRFQMEYRYQIIYVKYASTRLKGELVNIRNPRIPQNDAGTKT